MEIIIAKTQKEFFEAIRIRAIVFHDEQHVLASIEVDEVDQSCAHVLLYDKKQPKAVLRLIEYPTYFQVGRVAVLKENRHQGYGKALMRGIETLEIVKAKKELRLDVQMQAIGFYEQLGYEIWGEPFEEAGIMHRHAIKRL